MFDPAQEFIGPDQVPGDLFLAMAAGGERRQGPAGRCRAQPGVAAAPDQLLGLGEKLDFADAAAAELDVVSGHRDIAAAPVGLDLALDGMDVLDGGEIQVLAPHIRSQLLEESLAGFEVAGRRPGLDHRRALPVLAQGFVIGFRRQHRYGHRRNAGVGAQPQVGAEDVAVGGAFLHQAHQAAGQMDEMVLQGVRVVGVYLFLIEKDDEVDVARVIELPRPQFSHGDDDQPRIPFRIFRVFEPKRAPSGSVAKHLGGGEAEGGVGEIGERAGDFLQRPSPGDVGDGHRQRHFPLGGPERPGQGLGVLGSLPDFVQAADDFAKGVVRPGVHQPAGEGRILENRSRQEGAVAEHRFQKPPADRVVGRLGGEILQAVAAPGG